jgi:hypothetical protein
VLRGQLVLRGHKVRQVLGHKVHREHKARQGQVVPQVVQVHRELVELKVTLAQVGLKELKVQLVVGLKGHKVI